MKGLLAVDLDGTMLGDDLALDRLNRALLGRREEFYLTYVTGRSRRSALDVVCQSSVLRPDFLVSDVGGSICRGADWLEDLRWRRRVGADWQAPRLRAVASLFPALAPQPGHHQGEFKLSYYLSDRATLRVLSDAIRRQRLRARLIYSSERDLDIVPSGSGKGAAVAYLAAFLGLSPQEVFTCGDSANDLEMLAAGYCSAVVGNAHSDLRERLPQEVFQATGRCAAGVHEGLRHYGWL